MGGRGADGTAKIPNMGLRSANKANSISLAIKNKIIESAMNSKLKGVQRDATNGTGNYSFKNAQPVSDNKALTMSSMRFIEKDGNTLVHGLINGKHVFIANKSDSDIIDKLRKRKEKIDKGYLSGETRPEIRTTTTYDRWRKRNKSNFDSWFGKR